MGTTGDRGLPGKQGDKVGDVLNFRPVSTTYRHPKFHKDLIANHYVIG